MGVWVGGGVAMKSVHVNTSVKLTRALKGNGASCVCVCGGVSMSVSACVNESVKERELQKLRFGKTHSSVQSITQRTLLCSRLFGGIFMLLSVYPLSTVRELCLYTTLL